MTFDGCSVEIETGAAGSSLMRFGGEIDLANAHQVRAVLDEALARSGDVLIDLGSVDFLDSTGLAAFLLASEAAISSGSSLRIQTATPAVLRLLEVSGLQRLLLDGTQSPGQGTPTGS